MITQSVGVPRRTNVRLARLRARAAARAASSSARRRDWFFSGATTQTSEEISSAMRRRTSMPSAPMPSSLVTRMRMRQAAFSIIGEAAHVGAQRLGDDDRAVGLLVVLEHGDQRAADREAGAVERVHEARVLGALRRDSARSCAAPGSRRRPSRRRSRGRRPGPAATPRCRRSSARQSPCRRCTAAMVRNGRPEALQHFLGAARSCARARRGSARAW